MSTKVVWILFTSHCWHTLYRVFSIRLPNTSVRASVNRQVVHDLTSECQQNRMKHMSVNYITCLIVEQCFYSQLVQVYRLKSTDKKDERSWQCCAWHSLANSMYHADGPDLFNLLRSWSIMLPHLPVQYWTLSSVCLLMIIEGDKINKLDWVNNTCCGKVNYQKLS